jgi:hypothetical protein
MWVLIIMLWGDGRAMTQVPGFTTEKACEVAKRRVKDTGAQGEWVCVKVE